VFTSDGGLILVRELDERLGLGDLIAEHLSDARRGKNTQLPLADLFRQSLYSRMAGYEDVNDAERLSQDPAFRLIGSEKVWDRGVPPAKKCKSRDQEERGWYILNRAGEPKMEIPGNAVHLAAAMAGRAHVHSPCRATISEKYAGKARVRRKSK
jgi:predicted ribosome quality control (RQC) complex YloA/Tae2 family protein